MINENSVHPIGRWSEIEKTKEIIDLKQGMDFREPQYRREVFLRFYEFHLKYRSHPGAVYFMFPYLQYKFSLTEEDMYWLTFINGVSQNIVTTWTIFKKYPNFNINPNEIQQYILDNWNKLEWDMDRRYCKTKFGKALESYQTLVGNETQKQFWEELGSFKNCWETVLNKFYAFGRLSTFSFLEYQRIIGLDVDCDELFLTDMSGSKSHRNGLAIVLGRDDLDWHNKTNPNFQGYKKEHLSWLIEEGELLLEESKIRFKNKPFYKDVSYFTLESTLCCYKSWHRKNRRYPNVYVDMFHDRIKRAEKVWEGKEDFNLFWEAREKYLPNNLRLECNPSDPGLHPIKQNHYLKTGQVIMMDNDWECFKNDFNQNLNNNLEKFI